MFELNTEIHRHTAVQKIENLQPEVAESWWYDSLSEILWLCISMAAITKITQSMNNQVITPRQWMYNVMTVVKEKNS